MASGQIALFVSVIGILIIVGYIIWNEKRMRLFLRAKGAESLTETLREFENELKWSKEEHEKKRSQMIQMDSRLARTIQKIETVRFNAFPNAGGGQSFATVLLDEAGNGVIISALHHREHVSVFAKPIKSYESSFALSPEEEDAIKRTKTQVSN